MHDGNNHKVEISCGRIGAPCLALVFAAHASQEGAGSEAGGGRRFSKPIASLNDDPQ